MKTIKTLSNISYNTDAFFQDKITDLVNRGIIDWCYWIRHFADTDETKDHIHFVFRPSARIDTADFRKHFIEIDFDNPDKPLCCTTVFRATNSMDDWLLYAVHDPFYLQSKGQSRNLRYSFEDIKATDYDALRYEWNSIDRLAYERLGLLTEYAIKKAPFYQLVQSGIVPIAQRAQYEKQYTALVLHYHSSSEKPVKINSETGEILDASIDADDSLSFDRAIDQN